jgi:O-antigen ligase
VSLAAPLRLRRRDPARTSLARRRLAQYAVTIAVAAVVGREIALLAKIPPQFAVAVLPLLVVLYLFIKDPKWPLAALVAATCFGLYQYGFRFGPLNVRLTDIPFLFLVPWAAVLRTRQGRRPKNLIGQQYVGLFLGAITFTLFVALVRNPDDSARLVVAMLRLFSTAALIWIVPRLISRLEDVLFLFRTIAVCIAAELLWAIARLGANVTGDRLRGSNGPNAEGLLGVLLIILALYAPAPKSRTARIGMVVLGGLCLYLTRSIASLTALGMVVGIFGLPHISKGESTHKRGLLRPARLILLVLGLVGLVSMLRPLDLPTSDYFRRSSAGSRLLVGVAGMKVFKANPVFGVGWQRSSRPDVIATPELVLELRREFPEFPDAFFPVVGETSITVHNAYIQILAETGIVGGAVFLVAVVGMARRSRRVLRSLTGPTRLAAAAAAYGAVACVVWLNDNPIFGAQPETVLLCTLLGVLSALAVTAPGGDEEDHEDDEATIQQPGARAEPLRPVLIRPGAGP